METGGPPTGCLFFHSNSFQLPSHSHLLHHVPISSAWQFTVDLASSNAKQWWRHENQQ